MSKWQQPYGSNGTILTNDILLGVKDYLLLRKFRAIALKIALLMTKESYLLSIVTNQQNHCNGGQNT